MSFPIHSSNNQVIAPNLPQEEKESLTQGDLRITAFATSKLTMIYMPLPYVETREEWRKLDLSDKQQPVNTNHFIRG